MKRVLLTAFGPFAHWEQNASWLALQALTRDMPTSCEIVTRLYPVNFVEARARIASDLSMPFDGMIHLGQSAKATGIELEQFALNAKRDMNDPKDLYSPIEQDGPAAYRSQLPLASFTDTIRNEGIPAKVSTNAGTYLCNAMLYWSHYFSHAWDVPALSTFVHLPLDPSQVTKSREDYPSMPAEISAFAIRLVLERIVSLQPSQIEPSLASGTELT